MRGATSDSFDSSTMSRTPTKRILKQQMRSVGATLELLPEA